jgi:hypothetical protein
MRPLQRSAARAAIFLPLLALGGAGGCSPDAISPAVGPNGDVSLFTTLPRTDPAVQALARSLTREIYTTQTEQAFALEFALPGELSLRRDFKNLLFVTSFERSSAMTSLVRDIVGSEVYEEFASGERPFAVYSDVYAAGQTVLVVAAPTREDLAANMERLAPALYDTLEARVRQGLETSLYIRGEHDDLTDYLERTRNWTIRVPKDYTPEEDADRDLLIVHTEGPERWLFVQSAAMLPEDFTPEGVLAFRRAQPRIYSDEEVRDEDLVVDRTRFAGHDAVRIRGRWQSSHYTVGGPMVLYAIHVDDVLYVIDYLVFLPGMEKLAYLRQLDAIAHTFRLDRRG